MSGSILARTARGAGWVVAWRMLTRLLGLVSTLVLVRLLAPEDFGLVALATAFAVALDIALSIGVEDQIVRAANPTRALYDTAFTLNLMRALAAAALLASSAGTAAAFFGDARLEDVLLALAASAAISGLTNIGVADFRRHLAFDKEFKLLLLPRLLGITLTLSMAWLLRSHWALVIGILGNRLGVVAMSHALHPYRPRLSLAAWRDLVGVSVWSWANSLASVVKDRADSFAIGRMLGPAPLGTYTIGVEVAVLPTTEMVDPICRACMPGFAATMRDGGPEALGRAWLRIVALMALLTLPAGIGTSLIAGPVVALAFGQGWRDVAPVITIIAMACAFTVAGTVSGALLNARAALRTIFAITVASAALRILLLLALVPSFGVLGAAYGIGLVVVLDNLALVAAVLRMLRLSARRLLAVIARPALATAVMALVLWGSGLGWVAPPASAAAAWPLLLVAVPLGAVTFSATVLALWLAMGRPPGAEADMLDLLRRLWSGVMARRQPANGALT
jgi:O-antigen/teichoic acid export membrane protein